MHDWLLDLTNRHPPNHLLNVECEGETIFLCQHNSGIVAFSLADFETTKRKEDLVSYCEDCLQYIQCGFSHTCYFVAWQKHARPPVILHI